MNEINIGAVRHSAAHIMAAAIQEIYPNAQFAFGPDTDNGFYYDVLIPDGAITEADLGKIEDAMKKIAKSKHKFEKKDISRDDAKTLFANQKFKLLALDNLLKDEQTVSVYTVGNFTDLCRGPHVDSTAQIDTGGFKLDKLAGAYWLGDSKNEQLQRVYGLCFATKDELKEHIHRVEEAKKRDHRLLGKQLDLYSFHEEAPGMVFWHPRGVELFNALQKYLNTKNIEGGYREIKTPVILNEQLWHRSGHYANFRQNMYFTDIEGTASAVKPMNCPGSILVYKEKLYSFRDLPLRLAEIGLVHRHELSGVLHGLFRLRAFTIDDAHIYTPLDRMEEEVSSIVSLTMEVYRDLGFTEMTLYIATRPDNSLGTDEQWEQATSFLKSALDRKGYNYKIKDKEGAFYGPKIEFNIKDSIGRDWQLGTVQVDFSMPARFELEYVGSDGAKHTPVLIHRAIVGSIERFVGVLIEHTAGNLPVWLSPLQAIILPITDEQGEYARKVESMLKSAGLRAETDHSTERIGKKVRNAQLQKIPHMLVIGKREAETGQISLRLRSGEEIGPLDTAEFVKQASSISTSRSQQLW